MDKKTTAKMAAAAAALTGAGAAVMLAKKKKNSQKESASGQVPDRSDWRNTERGKQEKNSKGIYYSNGNYEAFARPEKPAAAWPLWRRPAFWCGMARCPLPIFISWRPWMWPAVPATASLTPAGAM